MRICVFCSSSGRIDGRYVELASAAGTELARRGHTLVSGGAIVSCMGAVARAAREGGAQTIGVIPKALVDVEIADDDSGELVVTEDMRSRKGEMDRRSDGFLVLPGGLGTLEELFEVWTSRMLGMHRKPIAILDPHGLYDPLKQLMTHLLDEGFARPHIFDAVVWTTTVEEAFDHLESVQVPLQPTAEDYVEAEP